MDLNETAGLLRVTLSLWKDHEQIDDQWGGMHLSLRHALRQVVPGDGSDGDLSLMQ